MWTWLLVRSHSCSQDEVQLAAAQSLRRIACQLILPHWLQLMGKLNPLWFNQRNDGRLARYFTAIYCNSVLLMTLLPLPFAAHPPLCLSADQFFCMSFTLALTSSCPSSLPGQINENTGLHAANMGSFLSPRNASEGGGKFPDSSCQCLHPCRCPTQAVPPHRQTSGSKGEAA